MGNELVGEWALVGFNGQIAILLSNEVFNMPYMEACKIAEKKALEKELECGLAIEMKSIWKVIRKSAECSNQEVLRRRINE
jgi:hypothetical protein